MKKSTVLVYGVIGLVTPFIVKHYYTNICKKAAKEALNYIREEVKNERTEEVIKTLNEGKELEQKANEIFEKERIKIKQRLNDFISTEHLNEKKNDISKKTTEAIAAYKKEISYDERLRRLKKVAEEELQAYKETVDYDTTIKALRSKKKVAEETYSKQLATLRLTIGSGNTGYSEMKSAFKNERNRVIEDADESIKKMEEKLKDRESEINNKLSKKISELKEELSIFEDKANSMRDEELEKIKKRIDDKVVSLHAEIADNRSNEENDIIDKAMLSKVETKKIADEEILKIDERVHTIKHEKIIAIYLTNHGWTVKKVIFVASIPLVAWGYVACKYYDDVKGIILAMKELKGDKK